MSPRSRLSLFAVPLLLAAVACASPSGAYLPPGATPVFKPATCPFSLKGGKFTAGYVRCGYVLVPENRSVKHSPTIRLAVAVFKARADPIRRQTRSYISSGVRGAMSSDRWEPRLLRTACLITWATAS